jgi:hypothetical protein
VQFKNKNSNPYVSLIHDKIANFNEILRLLWVPLHIGIIGNESDVSAKEATKLNQPERSTTYALEFYSAINRESRKIFQSRWDMEGKLKLSKNSISPWSWRDEVVITRLRIGHPRLTHSYLMDRTDPPICNCSQSLTVPHIFSCLNTQNSLVQCGLTGFDNLKIDEIENYKKIIDFMKRIKLYDEI